MRFFHRLATALLSAFHRDIVEQKQPAIRTPAVITDANSRLGAPVPWRPPLSRNHRRPRFRRLGKPHGRPGRRNYMLAYHPANRNR